MKTFPSKLAGFWRETLLNSTLSCTTLQETESIETKVNFVLVSLSLTFNTFQVILGTLAGLGLNVWLTHFMPLVSFYIPWKHQKTKRFSDGCMGV